MKPSQFAAKLFFVTGLAFPVLSLALGLATGPSFDVYVHDSYFVIGHFHLLLLSGLVFWVYGLFYFLGVRLFALPFSRVLTTLHMIVTGVAFLGFGTMGYVGLRQSGAKASQLRSFLGEHWSLPMMGYLFLLSAGLFVLIVVLAVVSKRRQAGS